MKRLIIILAIVVVLVLILGFLVDQGYIQNIKWQWLTVILSAIAGPYAALKSTFSFDNDVTSKIANRQEETRKKVEEHRVEYDQIIAEKKMHVETLNKEVEVLEKKLEIIEERKKDIRKEVNNMTTEEKVEEAQDLWGS